MKSCSECIRVDKDCAYCTDQVSCLGHPAPLLSTLHPAVESTPTAQPPAGQVWENRPR